MKLGNPHHEPEAIAEFMDGIVGVVEANSYERHCLWLHYAKEAEKYGGPYDSRRYPWKEGGGGPLHTVGCIKDDESMPVCVSLLVDTIGGHRILFVDVTSRYVDHTMVRKWVEEVAPKSAWDGDRLNWTDANNFCNVLHAAERMKEAALAEA